jgi:hypothetical protein
MLLNRNLETRDFVHKSDANFKRHENALPGVEDEIREIEALLTKLRTFQEDFVLVARAKEGEAEEAPRRKLAPSEAEKTADARKRKTS